MKSLTSRRWYPPHHGLQRPSKPLLVSSLLFFHTIVGYHRIEAFTIVPTVPTTLSSSSSAFIRQRQQQQQPSLLLPLTSTTTTTTTTITKSFTTTTTTQLPMALIPLPVEELEELLVTGLPTASQYSTYWGRTSREQYANFFESATVTLLGVFCSYFLSFVVGSFPATLLGFLFAFWTILSPELKAFSRNWELRGGRNLVDIWSVDPNEPQDKQGLYGSLFIGHVQDVSVVEDSTTLEEYDLEDFQDYTMEYDEHEQWTGTPYLLRIQIGETGRGGRQLQLHARMSEEYLDIEPSQPIVGVLLSTSQSFSKLAAMTDLYIPDAECWVGDYPYLDRFVMEELLAQNDDVWDLVEAEREESSTSSTGDDDDGTPQVLLEDKEYNQKREFLEDDDVDDDDEEEYDSYYDDKYYEKNDDDDDSILKSSLSSRKEKVPIRKRGRRRP